MSTLVHRIENYATIDIKKYDSLYEYIHIIILKNKVITSIVWEKFKQNLLLALRYFKEHQKPFGFIFNLRQFELLSIVKIKEIVQILEDHSELLEGQLIATGIIIKNKVIINSLFNIVKRFYKTKKPLTFVENIDKAHLFIKSNHKID